MIIMIASVVLPVPIGGIFFKVMPAPVTYSVTLRGGDHLRSSLMSISGRLLKTVPLHLYSVVITIHPRKQKNAWRSEWQHTSGWSQVYCHAGAWQARPIRRPKIDHRSSSDSAAMHVACTLDLIGGIVHFRSQLGILMYTIDVN